MPMHVRKLKPGLYVCEGSARDRAAQPGCSSHALRRSGRAGGGRRSVARGQTGRGAGSPARLGSLEYTDVVIRRHLYPQTMRRRPPFVLGYDIIGEIDQLGDGVSGFQLGDRVADMTVVG